MAPRLTGERREANVKISEVEGIDGIYADKLVEAGITTTEALLERGSTPRGRTGIESATGISGKLILEWVNHVDLMRLDGVGSEYADLLEAAGVDSPAELAHRNPANLAQTFQELVAARPGTVRRIPSEATVAGWIEEAKSLDKAVSHGGDAVAAPSPAAAAPAAPAPAPAAAAGHDHGHDHDHGHAHDAAPAPAAAAAPSTAKAPARPEPPPAKEPAKPAGLWAKIKGMFGGS